MLPDLPRNRLDQVYIRCDHTDDRKNDRPMILNIRWMIVVLLALTFIPIEARTAVMQVPMFCPNSTYTALDNGTIPVAARACRIPTDADED